MKIWVQSSDGKVLVRGITGINIANIVTHQSIRGAGVISLAYILTIGGLSLTTIGGKHVNQASAALGNACVATAGIDRNSMIAKRFDRNSNIKTVLLPNIDKTVSNSFMSSFFHVLDSTTNPLARQRQYLKGHQLSQGQKLHFYALALAELGPNGTSTDYAMIMETAYNRGITEGDISINQNLTRAYYEPLRKYRYKSYTVKIKVGKGKKRRTKRVKRTKRYITAGYKNYRKYKKLLQSDHVMFAKLDSAHQIVLGGSNFSNYGTQNASAGVARRARKTQTITASTSTGETISRKDLVNYSKRHGYSTVINTKRWVNRTSVQLAKYRELAKSPTKLVNENILQKYNLAVKRAKSYLRTVAVGGAAGLEGSGKIMRDHGFDPIGNLNNPTAIKVANSIKKYNKYAVQNNLPKAELLSAARFGHLDSIPGAFTNKTKSQHSAGLAVDISFGKGMAHANNSEAMHVFSRFAKAEGLYWGKEIYGDHEGHHWQSHPGKHNIFKNLFDDGKIIEAEAHILLHADPFNPLGVLVVDQMNELMVVASKGERI